MNRPRRAAYLEARKALADLPFYMQSKAVEIDGERYVRLVTVLALFCHTEQGQWFRRRWTRWFTGGLLFEDHAEGADDFLQAAFDPSPANEVGEKKEETK